MLLHTLVLAASVGLVAQTTTPTTAAKPACPPAGHTRASLLKLKEAKFEMADAAERNRTAVALLGCLDDADPAIRDGVVFEGLSRWLRTKALTKETILALGDSLRAALGGPKDAAGFRRPFAALILSEVARADRIEPVFPDEARSQLIDLAGTSYAQVDDYRGFDAKEGWRHGVAHGSDLILQLAVNPKVDAGGLRRLMDALRSQIAPPGRHSYTFGEPERIARAAAFAYRRGVLDSVYWEGWFDAIADPKPSADWNVAFQTPEGLAKRHNALSFLHSVSFAGRAAGDEAGRSLAVLADKAITKVMGG